ncbi:hypothetical protein Tco_0269782 [Tanacetum coccineum]
MRLGEGNELTGQGKGSHSTNNQLRASSNPRNQATIQDGGVTVQQVQGRTRDIDYAVKAVQTYPFQHCAFQTEDLDAYDSDYDDVLNAKNGFSWLISPAMVMMFSLRLSRLFSGTVRFRNDQVTKIMGLVTISWGTIMNPQETQQVVACDEKWVPSTERVKISSTNVSLETTVHQKEETFQVVIDVIKNSTCFNAFTITCVVDAEVFGKILEICPRVKGEELTEVQDDDATLTFLIDLGYKGPLHKYTNMYMDHMHQP